MSKFPTGMLRALWALGFVFLLTSVSEAANPWVDLPFEPADEDKDGPGRAQDDVATGPQTGGPYAPWDGAESAPRAEVRAAANPWVDGD